MSLEQRIETLEGLVAEQNVIIAKLRSDLTDLHIAFSQEPQTRGPKPGSGRNTTKFDAWRLRYGDLKDTPAAEASMLLNVSTGQIYGIRYHQSHKSVEKDSFDAEGNEL